MSTKDPLPPIEGEEITEIKIYPRIKEGVAKETVWQNTSEIENGTFTDVVFSKPIAISHNKTKPVTEVDTITPINLTKSR